MACLSSSFFHILWMLNYSYPGHYDVIKWKHFPRYWLFVWGIHRSPVNSPHKGQLRGALMFSLICAWTNGWVNNRDADDFRCHSAHYVLTAMMNANQPVLITGPVNIFIIENEYTKYSDGIIEMDVNKIIEWGSKLLMATFICVKRGSRILLRSHFNYYIIIITIIIIIWTFFIMILIKEIRDSWTILQHYVNKIPALLWLGHKW